MEMEQPQPSGGDDNEAIPQLADTWVAGRGGVKGIYVIQCGHKVTGTATDYCAVNEETKQQWHSFCGKVDVKRMMCAPHIDRP